MDVSAYICVYIYICHMNWIMEVPNVKQILNYKINKVQNKLQEK